ncbi:hypothetical protein FRACA_2050003 [Frankia canadensis]|uniref:Uncharacterized protein n=1 Tax=Frankia canadensis TaxID=1836972 RepID=A0A2I2KQC1_9ACTN|nr:hypothetical protein [Frankia canadensis]SNQ47865.1 hypothetical protein FRACA_2050003 [Frankia canadensis]SOU55155.1 hypothetical protein FRACA_2050003 [Frankia canadensis]
MIFLAPLIHPFLQGAHAGWQLSKWLTQPVERPLTLVNSTAKNAFFAVCLFSPSGEAADTVSTGWVMVGPRTRETVSVPVPRVGSRWVALHGRSRKGVRTWGGGSGNEKRNFDVVLPSSGGKLADDARFTVVGPVSNSPELLMNQNGVTRLVTVSGSLFKLQTSFTYTIE